jgi:hypothetical protein
MKTYRSIIVLLALMLLAACGGSATPQVLLVTATPAPVVPATVDVNAVETEAAASVFATETAAAPTAVPPTNAPTAAPTTVPPTNAPTAAPGGNADFITNVVMATNTQGANFDPVGATTTFPPDATFHAVVTITNAPDNSKIKSAWYAVDVGAAAAPNTLIDQYELSTSGSRNIDFTLKPQAAWPPGTYRVDIFGNGTQAKSLTFQVQSVTASQVPAPTSTPTTVPPTNAPTAAPGGSANFITNVVMATGTQGDNFDPVGITTTFSADATFHAIVTIADAPDNSKFKAAWYAVDVGSAAASNSLIDQYELTANGSRNIDFTLEPKTTWPPGTYRVDIYANDVVVKSVTFQVQ